MIKKILVTGAAGFIGFHLAKKLLNQGHEVTGLDIIDSYYDVTLKHARLVETGINTDNLSCGKTTQSSLHSNYRFIKADLTDNNTLFNIFKTCKFDMVYNLAAQAGVRYSLTNPYAYINSNICGFMNILECCRHHNVKHLVYASSSSVYGLNREMPFSTHHNVDHPASIYAATKKSNELMAHTYSHLYGIPTTGLRFFTVYGPWGRPDMALFLFAKAILENKPIDVFNHGKMERDFTYIDDIVKGLARILNRPPAKTSCHNNLMTDPSSSTAPFKIYNIGNNNPVKLMDFIKAIEDCLGEKAKINFLPFQQGDVPATWANIDDLITDTGYQPDTPVEKGIKKFIAWYKEYYKIQKSAV